MTPLAVAWRACEPPLAPVAVAGRGTAARGLVRVLLARDGFGRLHGVAGPELVVVTGPGEELPWAEGAVYLGRHPDAPGVLFPTLELPDVALPLYARAVLARVAAAGGGAPVAVLRDPAAVVPLGTARPLDAGRLRGWLEASSGSTGGSR